MYCRFCAFFRFRILLFTRWSWSPGVDFVRRSTVSCILCRRFVICHQFQLILFIPLPAVIRDIRRRVAQHLLKYHGCIVFVVDIPVSEGWRRVVSFFHIIEPGTVVVAASFCAKYKTTPAKHSSAAGCSTYCAFAHGTIKCFVIVHLLCS